jgi:hypothetical protein
MPDSAYCRCCVGDSHPIGLAQTASIATHDGHQDQISQLEESSIQNLPFHRLLSIFL